MRVSKLDLFKTPFESDIVLSLSCMSLYDKNQELRDLIILT